MKRMLRLEALEQRQLMAADIMPFHNPIVANDVNGDFTISPLDALVVINRLNSQGSGSLAGQAPSDVNSFVDTDNDNSLSPLDALVVINAINNGEGAGELVQIRYKFFSVNADGTAGTELPDPNPSDLVPEANIGTGERVIVRTQMIDLRGAPQGVFSAYHDLSYTNVDTVNPASEKLEYQWGEYNQIDIGSSVRGGTFTIKFGPGATDVTGPIAPAFRTGGSGAQIYDAALTAVNIRNALSVPFGSGNISVRVLTSTTSSRFGVNFIGNLAHTDVPNTLEVGVNGLVDGANQPISLTIGQNTADPSQDVVAAVGRKHNLDNNFVDNTGTTVTGVKYLNGPDGVLKTPVVGSPTRTITLMGGFSDKNSLDPIFEAAEFLNVVDTLFKGTSVGRIRLDGNTSPPPPPNSSGDNLGIALYGGQAIYLTSTAVVPGIGFLNINDKLTANTDILDPLLEDSARTVINVVANDRDNNTPARPFQVVEITQPSVGGTASLTGTTVAFTPALDYFGPVVFTYTIQNNATPPDRAVGTVSINVTPVNDAPNVIGTQFTIAEDATSPLVITPVQVFNPGPANENTQTVSFSAPGTTPGGTVSIVDGNINFAPAPNFFGNAIFTVTGTDTGSPASSRVATITVNVTPVNDAPVPFSGSLSVAEDGSLILIGSGAPTDLLVNSNPGPGEASTQSVILVAIPSITKAPSNGTIATVGGVSTYKPNLNFFGTDTFTYTITDNGTNPAPVTVEGTVTINVTSVNDAPVAVNDTGDSDRFVVRGVSIAGLPAIELDVLRNDSAGPSEPNVGLSIVPASVTTPTIGTATLNAAGTRILFTPPPNQFNVTSTFSYRIQDSDGALSSVANVEVFILPPVLPFAVTDAKTIAEDSGAISIDVLTNDFINEPGFVKSLLPFTAITADFGTVVQNGNALVYTPSPDYFGEAVFTYQMNDDKPASGPSTGTVRVTVTPVNDAPSAAPLSKSTPEDTVLTVPGTDITAGLSKGPREDAQTLTVTAAVNQTANSGTVAVVNGGIVYTPAKDFNGTVFVLYTVTDNGVNNTTPAPLTASATLTITVDPVNDAPIANADTAVSTAENRSVTIAISTLLANDLAGPANETPPQTVSFVSLNGAIATARGGSVTQLDSSTLIYTPAASFNGPDSFTYQISDGQTFMSTATGSLTVNVSEINDAPTAPTPTRSVFASVPTIFDLTAELAAAPKGPANESGQTLRVTRIIPESIISGRSVVLNPNGTITYTAPLGANGRDTFRYEVTDNGTTDGRPDPKTSIGTFNVDVSPFIPSTVRGVAYVDDNASGTLDAGELRLGGVEITLTVPATPTTSSQTIVKQTKVDGSYEFGLLPPGAYTVTYAVPMLTVDAPGANSFTRTIVAPGGVTADFNFSVLGVQPGYANVLENLASNFYMNDGSMRTSGIYAAVGANGRSEWTITRDGFAGDTFQEVVLSDDLSKVYVTAVRGPSHSVFTATLNRNQFIQVADTTGARLVRVLARSSELTWQAVSLAAPPVEITSRSRAYLDAVDDLFVQENW